jgi:hypothetical protein
MLFLVTALNSDIGDDKDDDDDDDGVWSPAATVNSRTNSLVMVSNRMLGPEYGILNSKLRSANLARVLRLSIKN